MTQSSVHMLHRLGYQSVRQVQDLFRYQKQRPHMTIPKSSATLIISTFFSKKKIISTNSPRTKRVAHSTLNIGHV